MKKKKKTEKKLQIKRTQIRELYTGNAAHGGRALEAPGAPLATGTASDNYGCLPTGNPCCGCN